MKSRMTTAAALCGFIVLCSLSCADAELYNYGDAGKGKLCAWNGQGTANTKTVMEPKRICLGASNAANGVLPHSANVPAIFFKT